MENKHVPHEFQDQPIDNELLRQGLDKAEQQGFSLDQSLRIDHPELSQAELSAYGHEVQKTSQGIVDSLGLDEVFYDRPANMVLLTAIADSWLATEERAAANPYDPKLVREREMLVDIALILGGEHSQFVNDLAQHDPKEMHRYKYDPDQETENGHERDAFFEKVTNPELSDKVQSLLRISGDKDLLAAQRETLGVTPGTEQPFKVRVLNIGKAYDFIQAGVLERPEFSRYDSNWSDEEKREAYERDKLAGELHQHNKAFAKPFEDAEQEYADRFQEHDGPLPGAMVRFHHDGTKELVLLAPEAYLLVNMAENPEQVQLEGKDLERKLAILRHEYGHTQKQLFLGAHHQLGLLLEERKAEAVSGDMHGYQDVKYLVTDLSTATGVKVLDELKATLKEDDPISAFLSRLGSQIGLRNTLLLMATKPLPYDQSPEYARQFADMRCLMGDSDISTLDVVFREASEKTDKAAIQERVDDAVRKIVESGSKLDFLKHAFIPYRKNHGAGHATQYYERAVDKIIAETKAKPDQDR